MCQSTFDLKLGECRLEARGPGVQSRGFCFRLRLASTQALCISGHFFSEADFSRQWNDVSAGLGSDQLSRMLTADSVQARCGLSPLCGEAAAERSQVTAGLRHPTLRTCGILRSILSDAEEY